LGHDAVAVAVTVVGPVGDPQQGVVPTHVVDRLRALVLGLGC
jgi:hypothetical protein